MGPCLCGAPDCPRCFPSTSRDAIRADACDCNCDDPDEPDDGCDCDCHVTYEELDYDEERDFEPAFTDADDQPGGRYWDRPYM